MSKWLIYWCWTPVRSNWYFTANHVELNRNTFMLIGQRIFFFHKILEMFKDEHLSKVATKTTVVGWLFSQQRHGDRCWNWEIMVKQHLKQTPLRKRASIYNRTPNATNIQNLQSLPSDQSLSSLGPQVIINFTKEILARVSANNIFLVTAGKN